MKKNKYFEDLKEGLNSAIEFERGNLGMRTTELRITEVPQTMSKSRTKNIRENLGVSQPLFAQLLGVSAAAVKAWEQGEKKPSGLAKRLIQVIEAEPQVLKHFSNLPKLKAAR